MHGPAWIWEYPRGTMVDTQSDDPIRFLIRWSDTSQGRFPVTRGHRVYPFPDRVAFCDDGSAGFKR